MSMFSKVFSKAAQAAGKKKKKSGGGVVPILRAATKPAGAKPAGAKPAGAKPAGAKILSAVTTATKSVPQIAFSGPVNLNLTKQVVRPPAPPAVTVPLAPDEIREVETATGFIYCGRVGAGADAPAAVDPRLAAWEDRAERAVATGRRVYEKARDTQFLDDFFDEGDLDEGDLDEGDLDEGDLDEGDLDEAVPGSGRIVIGRLRR